MKKHFILFITSALLFSCSAQKDITKGDKNFKDNYYKEAIWYYEKALDNPKLVDHKNTINRKLAESYIGLFNYKRASNYYENYFDSAPNPQAIDYFNYAQCLRSLGKVSEAKEVMREYSKATDDPEAKEYARIVFAWVEESDNGGPFILKKTNIDIGSRFSGMHLRDNFMYYSTPAEEEYSDFTAFYEIVKSKQKTDVSFNIGKKLKGIENNNYYNGSVGFNKNKETIYYTTSLSQKIDNNNPSYGNIYFGVDLQSIMSAKFDGEEYIDSKKLDICDEKFSYAHSYITKDGKSMYFASDMPGGYGGFDIYISMFENEKWSEPKNLGPQVNTIQNEMFPFFNNNELYFSSFGHIGFGGSDIFLSKEKNGVYSQAENLGRPINSQYNDLGLIFIDDANKKGYLATNRNNKSGKDEIFYISKLDPDKVKIFTDLPQEELEKTVPLELWKKYGNTYKFVDSKTAEKEGTEFSMEKGITYKVKAIVKDQENIVNDEVKINPENRIASANLKVEWKLPEVKEEVLTSLDTYIERYKANPKDDAAFKDYIKSIKLESGVYVVNGVFSSFSNSINTLIATKDDFGMKSTTIRYNKKRKHYYVMLYIGKDKKKAFSNLKALRAKNYFKEAWLYFVK